MNKDFLSNDIRAEVLVSALPYIRQWYNKTVVVKYGGNAMIDSNLCEAVMKDLVLLSLVGIKVILVHGGGPEITDMLNKIGKGSEFVGGLRYTDEETMDIVQMVLAGKINKSLVSMIHAGGGKAVGLCGADGEIFRAKKLNSTPDLGFVGEIDKVNPELIISSLEKGYIPVISSIASGKDTKFYNINADLAAAKIAYEIRAEKLILMTDVSGLMKNVEDETSLISTVNVSDVPALKNSDIISGGMIPKVECCVEAVRRGVTKAHIIDGRVPHSILIELLSKEGIGTMFQ